jgi:regulator of replication initiation timing
MFLFIFAERSVKALRDGQKDMNRQIGQLVKDNTALRKEVAEAKDYAKTGAVNRQAEDADAEDQTLLDFPWSSDIEV